MFITLIQEFLPEALVLFVFLGSVCGSPTTSSTVERAEHSSEVGPQWAALPSLPKRLHHATCAVIDDKLWVVGNPVQTMFILNWKDPDAQWKQKTLAWGSPPWHLTSSIVEDRWELIAGTDSPILHVQTPGGANYTLDPLPAPSTWLAGGSGGQDATLSHAGSPTHVHCGGLTDGDTPTPTCYTIDASSLPVQLKLTEPLPEPLSMACSGSDGKRWVLAGGTSGRVDAAGARADVFMLEKFGGKWSRVRGEGLGKKMRGQAGVLVRDKLVCIGGREHGMGKAQRLVQVYDVATGEVSNGPPPPRGGANGCAVVADNRLIWVPAAGSDDVYVVDLEVYAPNPSAPPPSPSQQPPDLSPGDKRFKRSGFFDEDQEKVARMPRSKERIQVMRRKERQDNSGTNTVFPLQPMEVTQSGMLGIGAGKPAKDGEGKRGSPRGEHVLKVAAIVIASLLTTLVIVLVVLLLRRPKQLLRPGEVLRQLQLRAGKMGYARMET